MELQPRTGRDVTAWGPDIAIPAVLPSKTVPDGGLVIHHQGAWTSERFVGAAGRGCRLEDVVARHPPSYAVLDVRTRWVTTCALPYGARRALLPVVGGRRSGPRRPPTTGGRDRVDGEPAPAEHRENRRQDRHDPYRTSGRHCVSPSRRHRRPRHDRLPGAALAAPGPLPPPGREATERSQRLPAALPVELGRRLPLGHDTDAAHAPGTRRLTDGAAVVRVLAGTMR
ncbi:ATP-dependent DNA ligase [Streptomyces sp. SPB78]|nr:ATP-dependent DNA ligase [Streptomyces sp. SPB78]